MDKNSYSIISTSLRFLTHLHQISTVGETVVSEEEFQMPQLFYKINIFRDYAEWSLIKAKNTAINKLDTRLETFKTDKTIYFSEFMFLLDPKTKFQLLKFDSDQQKVNAFDAIDVLNYKMEDILLVRRDHVVQDTLVQLYSRTKEELKLPLRVKFVNEDGIDAGGVRKEYFSLVLREILDTKYGMFEFDEETKVIWFKDQTFETMEMYNLIGKVCGLAIYNSVIIDLPFPLALYKKLLNRTPILSDLYNLSPSIARSLDSLLAYKGNDFEETFGLSFEITRQEFGEVRNIELHPGGSNKKVTKANVNEYVNAYINYIFNISINEAFNAFREGFYQVCNIKLIRLFLPSELMSMVVGNQDYDFQVLKKNTRYEREYTSTHEVIQMFWIVFDRLSLEDKKKFLIFLTGTDRIPILGMHMVKLCISSTNQSDQYYPVAHTCFNLLDLPKYSSIEILEERLLTAIQHTQGFTVA